MTVQQSHEIATTVRFSIREQLDWVADVSGACRALDASGDSTEDLCKHFPHSNEMSFVASNSAGSTLPQGFILKVITWKQPGGIRYKRYF